MRKGEGEGLGEGERVRGEKEIGLRKGEGGVCEGIKRGRIQEEGSEKKKKNQEQKWKTKN